MTQTTDCHKKARGGENFYVVDLVFSMFCFKYAIMTPPIRFDTIYSDDDGSRNNIKATISRQHENVGEHEYLPRVNCFSARSSEVDPLSVA